MTAVEFKYIICRMKRWYFVSSAAFFLFSLQALCSCTDKTIATQLINMTDQDNGIYQIADSSTPVKMNGKEYVVEKSISFDNKQVTGYRIYEKKKTRSGGTTLINRGKIRKHVDYRLTDSQKQWIWEKRIRELSRFDYRFMGLKKNHPEHIILQVSDNSIEAVLYRTKVEYMPSFYSLRIASDSLQTNPVYIQVWGFYTLRKDDKSYLVYTGMGEGKEQQTTDTSEFHLGVINLDTMETVYSDYILPVVSYEL